LTKAVYSCSSGEGIALNVLQTIVRLTGTVLLGISMSAISAAWQVPDELFGKLDALDPAQLEFINSGAILDYLPANQLTHELSTRQTDAFAALVNELMAVAEEMGYDPQRDMGAMPLNTASEGYNRGLVPTPPELAKRQRTPGPFSVHRYMFPTSGVPTFAGAKVAIYPQDLIAGNVDVAIVGIPNDMGSGRRNAEYGPRVMRALNTLATIDTASLVDPKEVLNIVDYGDFSVDNMSAERTVDHVTAMVRETAATGVIPMLVGGDTSMLYPGVKGVAQALGEERFGLIHFSAHPDVERHEVHTISDQQSVFLLLNEGIIDGEQTIQVGLRGPDVDKDTLSWLQEQGVRYYTMAAVKRRGYDSIVNQVLKDARTGPVRYFISIDVSVIKPAEMVAAGRIAADGLSVAEVTDTIRHLCAAKDVVGFEITDMAPMLDFSRLSAVNANAVLNACLAGIAVRKAGLKPDYIHPLAADHGQ
jgi:agmatinase